jgi:hypothetical protein
LVRSIWRQDGLGVRLLCNTTSGDITATLPPAAANPNTEIVIKKVSSDANTVTVVGTGSDTVEGEASLTINYGGSAALFVSDGVSNWDLA